MKAERSHWIRLETANSFQYSNHGQHVDDSVSVKASIPNLGLYALQLTETAWSDKSHMTRIKLLYILSCMFLVNVSG